MNIVKTIWEPSIRIIPSCYPPINLFESVTDPGDLDAVFALESMTNPRLHDEVGELANVPQEDRISGPGSSYLMAAFTHLNPNGSRFSDGNFGIYYAAFNLETAIAETVYHQVQHLRETLEPPQRLDMRVLHARLEGDMVDVRGPGNDRYYAPDSYMESQRLGQAMKIARKDGIRYWSVRHRGGECAAVFRPCLLSNCIQAAHLGYPWDGVDILIGKIITLSATEETGESSTGSI